MRRVVVFTLTSLDGAVEDPSRFFPHDGDEPGPPGYDQTMIDLERALLERQTALLLGRRTYDQWSRYWPTSSEQPFADFVNGTPKHVVTSTPLDPSPWSSTTTAHGGPLAAVVEDLRSQLGEGDIGVHASISLVRSLLHEGLADELVLAVAPVVDPVGPRLFAGSPGHEPGRWRLLSATPTESGAVWLRYATR